MGMDVSGRKPKNKDGEYFRANIWSWRPIHERCEEVNSLYNLGLDMNGWSFNDGNGFTTQEECDKLADAIESRGVEDLVWDGGMYVHPETGTFLKSTKVRTYCEEDRKRLSAWKTSAPHLAEFVKFLRNCGGFEIW